MYAKHAKPDLTGTARPAATVLRRLHEEELGAEAMEYALLGGAGAAACAGLASMFGGQAFQAFLQSLLSGFGDAVLGLFR